MLVNFEISWSKFIDILIILFGGWTLYAQIFTYSGLNFSQLVTWSPALLFILPLIVHFVFSNQSQNFLNIQVEPAQQVNSISVLLWIPLISLLCGVITKQLWVVALSTLIYLGWMGAWNRSFLCTGIENKPPFDRSPKDNIILLVAMAFSAILTLIINRPDIDDAYYLNAAITTINNPGFPLLSFDGMHGDSNIPIQQPDHRPQTYMLLIALLANSSNLSPRDIYYVILPPLWAAMVPVCYMVILRYFRVKSVSIALITIMLLLIAWGESHRVFGNFAFVRIFQSKAIFVSLLCPLLVYYALQFMKKHDWKAWLMLLLAQIASVGLSTTAAVVGPLTVLLSLIASAGVAKERTMTALAGTSTFIYCGLILLWVLSERVVNPGVADQAGLLNVYHVIGNGIRGSICLLLFLLLPLIMLLQNHPYRYWMWRYVVLTIIFLFNGFTTDLAGRHVSGVFSWRLFWAVPLPLFLGLCVGLVVDGYRSYSEKDRSVKFFWIGSVISVMVVFLLAGRWSISNTNWVYYNGPGSKVNPFSNEAAEIVLQHADRTDLVLAPEAVASVLTGYEAHPRMLYVRPHYTRHLQWHLGKREAETRLRLGRIADVGCASPSEYDWLIRELRNREVKVVVLLKEKNSANCVDGEIWLTSSGYVKVETSDYQIWISQV